MPTIDSKALIDALISHNGRDGNVGDPDVSYAYKIVEYTNAWGKQTWGVIYEGQHPDTYEASDYVRNPKTIWTRV